jgi:methyl-accepting chemotaxis protein
MAIDKIVNNNVGLIASISEAAAHLSHGARQIAQSAQHLAEGSSQQADSLQDLTKAVEEVRLQSDDSAGLAVETADNVEKAGNLMEQSIGYMGDMTQAMAAIDDSSKSIAKVIKVIDDIAFQTNILALNAAVEAARAGQHGKGFAVVANEVRNLASKSAAAAKETETLIADSISSVRVGGDVVKKTNDSIMQVNEISAGNIENMSKLKAASTSQNLAINEITENISNISNVVVSNTEAVHESAAAVQEMSAQAVVLEQMVARFRLP